MLNISAFLNSIDSAAKETLEVPIEPVNRNRKKNDGNSSHGLNRRDSERNLSESETQLQVLDYSVYSCGIKIY